MEESKEDDRTDPERRREKSRKTDSIRLERRHKNEQG